jgi:hypothetical protein
VLRRALAAGDAGRVPLYFHVAVIDRYRQLVGAQLLRTDSVGRVAVPGRWSLDLGVTPDERQVHLPVADLIERLPEGEREHWIEHLVEAPSSTNFLQMRMTTAACIDDGEPRRWE